MDLAPELWAMLDGLPDPVLVVDEDGVVVAAGARVEPAFGRAAAALRGEAIGALIQGPLRLGGGWRGTTLVAPCDEPPPGSGVVLLGVHRDGRTFPLRVRWSPLATAHGALAVATLVVEDDAVPAAPVAEAGSTQAELRALLERLPVMLAAVDERYQIVAWNAAAEKLSGYRADELVRNPGAMEILMPDPADRRALAEVAWRSSDAREWEWPLRSKDGQRKVVAWTSITRELPVAGWPVWGLAIDLTERKRAEAALRDSEAELRQAQRLACLGRFEIADGQPDHWSEEAALIFGRERGRFVDDVVHPADRARVLRALAESARSPASAHLELRIVRPDGALRHVEAVLASAAGKLVGTVLDVTERTLIAEAHARLAAAQEEERRRLTRELHDVIGHRLTLFRLLLRGLAGETTDGRRAEIVTELQALTERVAEDTRRLAWQLRPAALDELGLVAAARWLVETWSRTTGIVIAFDAIGFEHERVAPPLETAIYRILQEALTNVAKHAAARAVHILLAQQQRQTLLLVEDDGRGFDPTSAATRPGEGLAGMRERAALAGGTLEIDSTPKEGTRIYARFPLP